jgi:carbonic anhydrase
MEKLIEGYLQFRATVWPEQRALFEYLAKLGQRPLAMVIACSDSRVEPARIFGAGPGELFIVRNVANLVPPYETSIGYHGVSAALEFAVRVLEVPHVVVLGHAMCGGIRALLGQRRVRRAMDADCGASPRAGARLRPGRSADGVRT